MEAYRPKELAIHASALSIADTDHYVLRPTAKLYICNQIINT